jgi:predicted kinase
MTVNEVVETTLNRVELSRRHSEERPSTRIEAREFERLLQRAMEILSARAERATLQRS